MRFELLTDYSAAQVPQRILVTGAAHGIGRAVASQIAKDGGTVVLVDLDLAAVQETADEIRTTGRGDVHAYKVDVTNSATVARLFLDAEEALGGLDGLVNAAGGISQALDVEDIDDEEWRRVVDANLYGTFLCCRAAFPIMKRGGGGRIVNVSSEAARLPLWPTAAHYVAAKAGVIGLTKHLALEGGPFNINVNVAAPGVTLTEKTRAYYSAERAQELAAMTPVGRLAEVHEQVGPILFLLSKAASHITGIVLDVNGGRVMI